MRKLGLVVVAVTLAGLVAYGWTGTARAGQATLFRFTAAGAETDLSPDCPPLWLAYPFDVTCTDLFVIAADEADVLGGGSIARTKVPVTFLYLEIDRLTVHPDFSFELRYLTSGVARGPSVVLSLDRLHLGYAHASATVSMDDGTTHAVAVDWTGYGSRYVFGADGPSLQGAPFHLVTPCLTVNNHWHQKFTNARSAGTIDGVPLPMIEQSPPFTEGLFASVAAIFNNQGSFLDVAHGGCG
jgi:hypothetical protein